MVKGGTGSGVYDLVTKPRGVQGQRALDRKGQP